MKFLCNQSDLNSHLSFVSRAVPSRPAQPVLGNILVKADTDSQQVELTAFDLSLGLRTAFAAKVEAAGEITIPAKLLHDIAARLPAGEVTIDNDTSENTVNLTSQSGRYQVRGMSAEEFPSMPEIENDQSVQLSAEALLEGLRGSVFATSSDETKQVLTGVHLILGPDTLEFAATDGHRLAVVETENSSETDSNEEFEVTIPAKALRELEKMIGIRQNTTSDQPLLVNLHLDQGQVVFELADQRLTSRTIEGQYPAYRQLLPDRFQIQVTVDRRQLIGALDRIAILASQKNDIVKFIIDSETQQLSLSVEAADVGSGSESMTAQISGDSLDIAFNAKYAMESLKNLPSTEISMQLNSANSPVIIVPLGGVKMTHLLMPVQLRG
ncbi:MAG TPA: DNA polymerase III subunit beta [Oscillatoriaceae cyanobacterium M33_DOE_052]|uniref:Beta sliding clamp n=1 Tax=Planktothricoides sp. SpSt-374 TaxID=2282167 RepID=A0A7C3VT56_9CYAN|nr:DNA polymerase III subunit beta [Oscillatoriaceae cyanobacterium M33_DOE_052]